MPKVNFKDVDDVQDFAPLPAGRYLVQLDGLEESATQSGDAMWKLRFVVSTGPFKGRYIFDNMVFSRAALRRAKLICSCLGLDVAGELDLSPGLMQGRTCYIRVNTEEYEDRDGNTKKRNVVPFAGYERVNAADVKAVATGEGQRTEDDGDTDVPF